MKNSTVGLFNDGYLPIMDGVTITVRNYALWLNKIFGRTYVITPFVPFHKDREGIPVIRYLSLPIVVRPPYRIGLHDLDFKLQYLLRKKDFSIIHAHTPFSAGILALRTAKEKRVPLVATFHTKYKDDLMRAIGIKVIVNDAIKRIIDFYYQADHVWVPQKSVGNVLREYGYKGPYDVVENGTDMEPGDSISELRAQGGKEMGFSDTQQVGLYVGQMILEKNLEFLLHSLKPVFEKLPQFEMVMVGGGYAKQKLMALAQSLGIAHRMHFRDVILDRQLLASVYARSDVFLFPSLYDNAPLVVREAAAFGVPALMIHDSTAAEVITEGENGFLAENEVDAYSEKIIAIMEAQAARQQAGQGARTSLARSWRNVVEEVKTRYTAILERWEL